MPIMLDPRPGPAQVQACFAAPLSDEALGAALAVLAADPNWLLHARPSTRTWDGSVGSC